MRYEMHAPPGLVMIAAVLGILVPLVVSVCTVSLNDVASVVVRVISLAVVPVLAARIAYRQGYDQGAGKRSPATV